MSYILDALQKNAADDPPAEPAEKFPGIGTTPPTSERTDGSLALPWKLAIGAILIANVALVFLWRTDRPANSGPELAANASPANPATNTTTMAPGNNGQTAGASNKRTLPGILSPRDLPPPTRSAPTNTGAAGTLRTFRPTGRPVTIAGDPELEAGVLAENTQPPATRREIPQRTVPAATSSKAGNASALSAISDSAREALYALTFSFHIFGSEPDLRSVGVNGQRRIEGESVRGDNGKTFTIAEITDNGAIIEFDHEGETVSVAIPVMEDWKDS